MPNFLMLTESDLFPIPEYKRLGGKGGGGGLRVDAAGQMRLQEEMYQRQMNLQRDYQIDAERRIRAEQDRQRMLEYERRQESAAAKETKRLEQEQQETATFMEMTGQTKKETSEFGGGFNLDMPTIERPGYEGEDRPL